MPVHRKQETPQSGLGILWTHIVITRRSNLSWKMAIWSAYSSMAWTHGFKHPVTPLPDPHRIKKGQDWIQKVLTETFQKLSSQAHSPSQSTFPPKPEWNFCPKMASRKCWGSYWLKVELTIHCLKIIMSVKLTSWPAHGWHTRVTGMHSRRTRSLYLQK